MFPPRDDIKHLMFFNTFMIEFNDEHHLELEYDFFIKLAKDLVYTVPKALLERTIASSFLCTPKFLIIPLSNLFRCS